MDCTEDEMRATIQQICAAAKTGDMGSLAEAFNRVGNDDIGGIFTNVLASRALGVAVDNNQTEAANFLRTLKAQTRGFGCF